MIERYLRRDTIAIVEQGTISPEAAARHDRAVIANATTVGWPCDC
jgi:hypothetical protein